MARSRKTSTSEFEERLKALKQEQRRLAREIESMSKATQKDRSRRRTAAASSGSSAKTRRKKSQRDGGNRSSAASGQGVEMKSYLASGSFRSTRKLRHERAVQRNKAIFMVVLVASAMYIFFMWVY